MERMAQVTFQERFIIAIFALGVCAVLTGCTHTVVAEKPVPVQVKVRAECPSKNEAYRLLTTRPKQLRNGVMPTDPVERNGDTIAQLGLYEAEGAWADQVVAALNRCQEND